MASSEHTQQNLFEQENLCHRCKEPMDRLGKHCQKCRIVINDRRRQQYAAANLEGLCSLCTEPKEDSAYKLCVKCRGKGLRAAKKRQASLVSKGLCKRCGKPAAQDRRYCQECLDRDNEKGQTRLKLSRICKGCARGPLLPKHRYCEKCGKKNYNRSMRDYRSRQVADGLCTQCDRPVDRNGAYCSKCLARQKAKRDRIKRKVMDGYGGRCNCCRETVLAFLTIDHINDDGCLQRRGIAGYEHKSFTGYPFYRWIIKNNFPADLTCLCFNCQWGKRLHNGVCPHRHYNIMAGDGEGI